MTMPQQPQVNVNINQPSIPQQPMAQPQNPIRQNSLRTKRGLLKYLLLGLVTFGIYDIWQMSEVGTTLNLIATRRDGKRTMHYCLMFFLLGWLTLGIGWLVWYHAQLPYRHRTGRSWTAGHGHCRNLLAVEHSRLSHHRRPIHLHVQASARHERPVRRLQRARLIHTKLDLST